MELPVEPSPFEVELEGRGGRQGCSWRLRDEGERLDGSQSTATPAIKNVKALQGTLRCTYN